MGSYFSYYWTSTPSVETTTTEAINLCFDPEPEIEEYDYILNKNDPQVLYGLYMSIRSGASYDPVKEILTVFGLDGKVIRYKILALE